MSTDLSQLANDRYEIADALHRFAFGLDHGDADSLASAFAEDCVLDFRPAGKIVHRTRAIAHLELDGFKLSSSIEDMPKTHKPVLEVLFPQVRAELLRALFQPPLKQRYVRELVVITGLAMHTIQDELRKLS